MRRTSRRPDITNKLLAQKACKICVAYDGMEKFFPADKIIMTGNPVRQNLLANKQSREAAVTSFGFNPEKKTILILGGSLGARTINQTLIAALDTIKAYGDIQFIWQTGKIYIQQVKDAITTTTGEAVRNPRISAIPNLYVTDFIKDMARASPHNSCKPARILCGWLEPRTARFSRLYYCSTETFDFQGIW